MKTWYAFKLQHFINVNSAKRNFYLIFYSKIQILTQHCYNLQQLESCENN